MLTEAINWGLLTPDAQMTNYLRVQPIFSYFLRTRLLEQTKLNRAINNAFHQHYDELSDALSQFMKSKEASQPQFGHILTRFEYENIHQALLVALQEQKSILNPYRALSNYLDSMSPIHRPTITVVSVSASPTTSPAALVTDKRTPSSVTKPTRSEYGPGRASASTGRS